MTTPLSFCFEAFADDPDPDFSPCFAADEKEDKHPGVVPPKSREVRKVEQAG
jgi:hypothetical protein